MKSIKDNLKSNEINNNIKQNYLKKDKTFDSNSSKKENFQINYNVDFNDCSVKSEINSKDNQRSSIELIDFVQQTPFELTNNETVELQKLISSSKETSTDGTMSRKQSIVSQESSDKRSNRKVSTVLELKDYKWTEEQEIITNKKSEERLNLKKLKQLESTIVTKDQESNQVKLKKNNLKNTERNRTWAYIFMLAFLILSMVIYSNYLEKESKTKNSLEYRIAFVDKELRTFDLLDDNGKQVLTVHYGLKIPRDIKPIKCSKLSKGGEFLNLIFKF